MTARSFRNNNPGNLESNQPWRGLMPLSCMSPDQRLEKRFAVFVTASYGFRALAVTINTYRTKHGLNTITGIISRWAPPGENDTQAYIKAVSAAVGATPYQALSDSDINPLCKAIAVHEAGGFLFTDLDLAEGIAMAMVANG